MVPTSILERSDAFKDVPEELIKELRVLEEEFLLTPDTLKKISDHFANELTKGLSKGGGNIPMNPTWVLDFPTGKEKGHYLAIDLGGTNLRIVLVSLDGNRNYETKQTKYRLPENMRSSTATELFTFIADCLKNAVDVHFPNGVSKPVPLGFTFSYPATQYSISSGILQRWTKGFDIDGVEGKDVVPMLQEAIRNISVPIDVVALINDTTGTLVASMYTDPEAKMGLIFGTGCNGAYYDVVGDIPKLEGLVPDDIKPDTPMAINCEYGAFDNELVVLPRTKYDAMIDKDSPRPGQQSFEKMISGYYLGEILRLILVDLADKGLLFKGKNLNKLHEVFIMDGSKPGHFEEDDSEDLSVLGKDFSEILQIDTTITERKIIRRVSELIGTRSARLSICGIAGICKKRNYKQAHCAADGSLYEKYPGFKERAAQALRDIFDWTTKEDPIRITDAVNGSGVGAAVIAALTENRNKQGLSVGLKKST